MLRIKLTYLLLCCLLVSNQLIQAQRVLHVDVLVVGGGASGITAGIQAARLNVKTLVVEETTWLGGMLSAAGVSATDGNHLLPSGLWGEFRERIYAHYGGPSKVATGWVSNTHFELKKVYRSYISINSAQQSFRRVHIFQGLDL